LLLDWVGVPRVRDETVPLPWAPKNRASVERMTDALIDEAAGRAGLLRPPEAVLEPARNPPSAVRRLLQQPPAVDDDAPLETHRRTATRC
jgi:hypothetical protein